MPNIYLRPEHANIKFPKWLPVPDTASGMASGARYRFGNGFVCPVPLRERLCVPGTTSGTASCARYRFGNGFKCPVLLREWLRVPESSSERFYSPSKGPSGYSRSYFGNFMLLATYMAFSFLPIFLCGIIFFSHLSD